MYGKTTHHSFKALQIFSLMENMQKLWEKTWIRYRLQDHHVLSGKMNDMREEVSSNAYYKSETTPQAYSAVLSSGARCPAAIDQHHFSTASQATPVTLHLLGIYPCTWNEFSAALLLVSVPGLSSSWIIRPSAARPHSFCQKMRSFPAKHIATLPWPVTNHLCRLPDPHLPFSKHELNPQHSLCQAGACEALFSLQECTQLNSVGVRGQATALKIYCKGWKTKLKAWISPFAPTGGWGKKALTCLDCFAQSVLIVSVDATLPQAHDWVFVSSSAIKLLHSCLARVREIPPGGWVVGSASHASGWFLSTGQRFASAPVSWLIHSSSDVWLTQPLRLTGKLRE